MNKKNYPNRKFCIQNKSKKISSNLLIYATSSLNTFLICNFIFSLLIIHSTAQAINNTSIQSFNKDIFKSFLSKSSYQANTFDKINFGAKKIEEKDSTLNSTNKTLNLNELLFLLKSNPSHANLVNEFRSASQVNKEVYEDPAIAQHPFDLGFLKSKLNSDYYFDLESISSDAELNEIYQFLLKLNKNNSDITDRTIEEVKKFASKNPKFVNIFLKNEKMSHIKSEWLNWSRDTRRTFDMIMVFLTCIICMSGLVGNILSLKVFCSTKLPRTSSRIYLIALAVSDGIFLVTHFLDKTCKEIVDLWKIDFPINITDQKQTMCRSFALLRNVCRAISPWLIVAFTFERFLVVIYPHHSSLISKPVLAKRFICVIILLSILVSMYAPILTGVTLTPKRRLKNQNAIERYTKSPAYLNYLKQEFFKSSCDILTDYRKIYLYLTIFYTFVVIIMPLAIVSILNTIIIWRMYKSTDQWIRAKLELHEQELSYKDIRDKKVQVENFKITLTLIIISASFIFLTLPYVINYYILNFYFIRYGDQLQLLILIQKVTELMYILNHSINFFLYIVTRNSFRRVLKEKLYCSCFKSRSYVAVNHVVRHRQTTNANLIAMPNEPRPMSSKKASLNAICEETKADSNKIKVDKNVIDPQTYENYWNDFSESSLKKSSFKCKDGSQKPSKFFLLRAKTSNNK
ncbi:thyrotropin-releasing hormone receptor [Brachionus plicatilis]|uniref:Thyrotropin-releasing hormone receptor n=1 Tax=Brachionus plicatilis TaxID=10195 RepID=A0A3M7Q615_BRAPC|nr:thyrotropin-releasing hormone receptor [Brachionus plicatilis]